MRKIKALFIVLLLYCPLTADAATYYVATTGSGSTCSEASPCGEISTGIGKMTGGDTLIVKSGTYTGEDARIAGMPSGSDGHPTTIKAESDFGAILSAVAVGTVPADEEAVINVYGKSYVDIEGFLVKDVTGSSINALSGVYLGGSNHCKIRKVGIKNGAVMGAEYAGGVGVESCSYCLIEDVFVCGYARYGIKIGGGSSSHHNICRRCVVRWDFCTQEQPRAAIANYGGSVGTTVNDSNMFQNCIVIDGNAGGGSTFTGGFSAPHETSHTVRYGCISLNNSGYGFHSSEDSLSHGNTNTHCISYDSGRFWWRYLASGSDVSGVYYSTLENVDAVGPSSGNGVMEAKNNAAIGTVNYTYMDTTSGNVVSTTFEYLPDSPEADAGATILKKMGTDGTLYGEEGYATLSDNDLWPWPYEDTIKSLFAEDNDSTGYYPADNDPTRGFADTGKQLNGTDDITLTSYIWEYLGNEIPADIYGEEADEVAPTVTSAAVNGSTVTVNFDETVVTTGYDAGDFDLDCSTAGNNIALSSPSGSGASRTFTSASAIDFGDTCNLDYTGSTDDIEDAAGNDLAAFSNTVVTNNTPDTTDPAVTITTPTSDPTYNNGASNTISLEGTSSDNDGVDRVTWSNDRGGSGTCAGTTSWSQTNISLTSGDNVITITAYDNSENDKTDTITVTYTPSTINKSGITGVSGMSVQ